MHRHEVTRRREAVVGQAHAPPAVDEEMPCAVLAHRMAGIEAAVQAEVHRITPRAVDLVRMDDVDRRAPALVDRDVQKVAAAVLDEVHGPRTADRAGQRGSERHPVHQVARMQDDGARTGPERRERHVVVRTVLQDRGVRVVTGHDGVAEAAVAQVGLALVLDAVAAARCRLGANPGRGARLDDRAGPGGRQGDDCGHACPGKLAEPTRARPWLSSVSSRRWPR